MPESDLPVRRSTHIDVESAETTPIDQMPAKPTRAAASRRSAQATAGSEAAAASASSQPTPSGQPVAPAPAMSAASLPSAPARDAGSNTPRPPSDGGAGGGEGGAGGGEGGDGSGAGGADEQPPRTRRTVVLIAMITAIAVLLGALITVSVSIASTLAQRADESEQTAAEKEAEPELITFPDDTPAAAAGAEPCTPVRVMSSFENADMVEKLAEGYNASPRDIDGSCVTVVSEKQKSGVAAEDATASFSHLGADARPSVWLPDSSMWLATAGADAPLGTATPIAYSDIVPAMPQSLAAAIGWDEKAPTWSEVIAAGADADLWSGHGHAEWGAFKLGKTSPLVATSGAAAMLASYGVAADAVGEVTVAEVEDPEVRDTVHDQELATSHYMATPEHFLWHARKAEADGAAADFLSAVIVDEKSVWDYNRGIVSRDGVTRTLEDPPLDPLVPIYPADGAYVADNPVVPLTGDWIDATEQAAAADFVRYTQTAQAQAIVRASGYRDLNRELDDEVERTGRLSTAGTKTELNSSGDVLVAAQAAFPEVRKRANVLFLLDVSGSMDEKISKSDTKLTQAKKAIESALDHFTPGDHVGLAAFAQDANGDEVPGQLTAMADIADNRTEFVSDLKSITSMGDTPLYWAVDTFAKQQAADWDPERINAIVLLSDGENDTNTATTTAATMLKTLDGIHHDTPVLVFTLAYGKDADVDALQSISGATGAHYYDATDPTQLEDVLGDLVTSF